MWKTRGSTQVFGREVGHSALLLTVAMMALVSLWTALTQPEVAGRWFAWPRLLFLLPVPLVTGGVALALWRSLWRGHHALPFVLGMALFLLGFGGLAISLWPYVVPRHVTVWTGAADHASLVFVGIGAAAILPLVLAYMGHAYWVFRGKVVFEADQAPGHPPVHLRRAVSPAPGLHLS